MLRNKTIFIFSLMKFDGLASTNYTIARELAKHNTVYYIDNPFTTRDCMRQKDSLEFLVRKPHFRNGAEGVIDTDLPGLKVLICPPVLTINFLPEGWLYRLLLRRNERRVVRRIRQLIRRENIGEYIFINAFNFHYPAIGRLLRPALQVYHAVDPIIVPYDRRHGLKSERELVATSDLVICTSKALYEQHKRLNPETYFVPNAADFSHSSRAADPALALHPSLSGINRPIAGYLGNIERRMDFALLQEVARSNADLSFVFAGPVEGNFIPDSLQQLSNVHFTGAVRYDEIPAVLKGFDVCMIPFAKDEVSSTIFPLKLFEYLGAGKPVVITDFNPDLQQFTHGEARFCSTATEFSDAIRKVLPLREPADVAARQAVAKENTWTRRGEEFSALLETALEKKKRQI
ncbi:glycosyl transferase family 1 [Pedobacter yulinensis]|uniref:Glycosyl transferase family 1 n=1 Tax=Pedobacter yulinensis TaxID=2126353 RepID=A0A2T3HLS3_9SPHI|nr:glycosyltransferase [Pedobacter yulinensis]PST83379.1 glycosyl transferase family 1 [Pedobacter yulinensis]